LKKMSEKLGYAKVTVSVCRSALIKFDLVERKRKFRSKEEITEELRRYAKEHGGRLRIRDVPGWLSRGAIKKFGSWNKALRETGIPVFQQSPLDAKEVLNLIESEGPKWMKEIYEAFPDYHKTTLRNKIRELYNEKLLRIRGSKQNKRLLYIPPQFKDAVQMELEARFLKVQEAIKTYRKTGHKLEEEEAYFLLEKARDGSVLFEDQLSESQRRFLKWSKEYFGFIRKEINGEIVYSTYKEELDALGMAYPLTKK